MIDRWLLERHLGRVMGLMDRLDDEVYGTAVLGDAVRARYLEWWREQTPRVLDEMDRKGVSDGA